MDTSIAVEQLTVAVRAELLKAVSDPTRLEMLDLLSSGERCNCHFQDHLDLAPNLLSYHLRVLREAGLIVGSRRGRWVDYRLAPDAAELLATALPAGLQR